MNVDDRCVYCGGHYAEYVDADGDPCCSDCRTIEEGEPPC